MTKFRLHKAHTKRIELLVASLSFQKYKRVCSDLQNSFVNHVFFMSTLFTRNKYIIVSAKVRYRETKVIYSSRKLTMAVIGFELVFSLVIHLGRSLVHLIPLHIPCETKVADLTHSLTVYQNVPGGKITMDNLESKKNPD